MQTIPARPPVTSAKPASCPGDCDASGSVLVDELVTGIHIALGLLPLDECSAFDGDGNLHVTVDELVAAVQAALRGCPLARPSFPVGVYFWPDHAYGRTGSALRDLADFGVNTVVAYYEYVKPDVPPFSGQPNCHGLVLEAEAFGIDFFIGSPRGTQVRSLDDVALRARLKATVDCVGASPRYRGWMFDEPELTGYDPALLARAVRILRTIDPGHQIWVNFNPYATDDELTGLGTTADIFGFDIYPIVEEDGHSGPPNQDLSVLGGLTERASLFSAETADVWMIVQAFGFSDLNEGTQGRRPTPHELRFMVYAALLRGARGIVFFGSHQLGNTIPLDEPVWDVGVRGISRELDTIGAVLLEGLPSHDIAGQPKSITVRGLRLGEMDLIMAANESPNIITGVVLVEGAIADAYEIFEDRHPSVDRNGIRDEFDGYGVHVYRITRSDTRQ